MPGKQQIPESAVRSVVIRSRVPKDMGSTIKYMADLHAGGSVSKLVYDVMIQYLRRQSMFKREWVNRG